MNQIISTLHSHRSIRKFTDQAVPTGLLEELLRAGQAASSSNNIQAYTVIRISKPELRDQLSTLAGNQAYINQAAEFLVFCADIKRNAQAVDQAGGTPILGMTEQLLLASVDTALMAQNVAVAAESEGLGICFIGAVRNHPAEISALLRLPQHIFPLFGMCLGYPAHDPEIKPRLPLAIILKQDTYDDQQDPDLIAAYDRQMQDYYQQRTGGTKDSTWSQELTLMFGSKLRPHLRDFLVSRGFAMK